MTGNPACFDRCEDYFRDVRESLEQIVELYLNLS